MKLIALLTSVAALALAATAPSIVFAQDAEAVAPPAAAVEDRKSVVEGKSV